MNIARTLDIIEKLINSMIEKADTDRLQVYSIIRTLILDIEKYNEQNNYPKAIIKEKIDSLLWNCQSIAKLDDGNKHSDQQHHSWAIDSIQAIKGPHGFKLN